MANWQAGAAFSNSFLNTIQGLTALQNAQMQNARLANQIQREQEYEGAVSEETQKAKGLNLGQAIDQLKFQDVKTDDGAVTTAAEQRQGLQQALPTLQQMTPAQQQEYLGALSQTEVGQGLGLEKLKQYQTTDGETKFNQLGREAMASDVNRAVRQRMLETGNIYGQEQALRMGKLTREDEAAQAEMDFSNWMTDQTKLIQADPTKWVQDNLTGYNKAGKGSFLNDGMTGKVTMSADGKTSSFVQMDKKGKVVASTPITAETAMQGLQAMAYDKFRAMPGKFKEAFTMGMEQEKLGETKRHNRAIEGIYQARNTQAGAGAAKANYVPLTGGYSFNTKTGKYVDIDGNAVTDPKVIADLNKLGQKADIKSLGEGLVQVGNQVYQQDAKSGEWVSAKGLPGSAPDKYASVLGGKDIDTSRPGAQKAPAAAPQQAIPVSKPDLSKWTMKPAGKTFFGEPDYVLEGPSGRMSLSDFIDRYGYNPSAEFIGRR
jgi:hypothetical protein